MSRARRGTGEQLCLMSTWEGGLKVVQWLQVMNVRYEREADIHNCMHAAITVYESTGSRSKSYALHDHGLFEKHPLFDHS